jgi:predicted RNase H-like nuclease (RuvC/YqgF family)
MTDNMWELIVLVVTNIITGGIIRLVTIRAAKRKEEAEAAQSEGKARQEYHKAKSQEIDNIEDVIKLYKSALEDMRSLSTQEKEAMATTIKQQDEKIRELKEALKRSDEVVAELKREIRRLNNDVKSLKNNISMTCKSCPQGKTGKCLNPKFQHTAEEDFFIG